MTFETPIHVLIIGAGPAGLLAAQALQKQSISCTVYEQDTALDARPRDWNFGIYWAQVPLGDCLPEELSAKIVEVQVDSRKPSADDFLPIYNGKTGEHMKDIPAPYNIRLNRRKFLKLISTGVDIQYGKRLQKVESDGKIATAYFEDGTTASGSLLIGAEGAHSKVRQFLLGPDKAALEDSPLVSTSAMAKLPRSAVDMWRDLHPRYTITFHPHGYFTWIGVHDAYDDRDPEDWIFMIIQSWLPQEPYDPATTQGCKILPDMKKRASEYGEPFRSILQSIPDHTKCWHNRLSYWVPQPWDNRNGTVTLIGDAAHSMTYHRGQGLNNAIHDVASLAKQLREKGWEQPNQIFEAISAYENEMQPRGQEAVVGSNQNSLATHDWNKLLQSPLFTAGLKQSLLVENQQDHKGE